MGDLIAWTIVVVAAAIGTLGLFYLTREFTNPGLRLLTRLLVPVWLLLPAPVPGFPGSYAPAFLIAIFEALFQVDGRPGQSLRLLVLASTVVILGVVGWRLVLHRRTSQ